MSQISYLGPIVSILCNLEKNVLVERQNEKRGPESGFGSAGYVNEI